MKNLTLNELNESGENIPEWHERACSQLLETLSNPEFPCFFGVSAKKNIKLRFFYIEKQVTKCAVESGLKAFNNFRSLECKSDYNLAITLGGDIYSDRDRLKDDLWSALEALDTFPKKQVASSSKEFFFEGEPYFVLVTGPFYKNTPSRFLSDFPIVLFQPREVFQGYEAGTKSGTIARKKIRDRVVKFDGSPLHSIVGPPDEKPESWWDYYFIPDKQDV
ncbi:YqcI/YcgG family protein [Halomonas sabkhae]|uniref:YqcI/YcgG family protein n=1 Tax=Halomonas sabkhae TaxID=626223 RepID=UPI0025B2B0DB|nr:YqcI/YcgG family protein [Halomonas sabkhae]MDN3525271.1 YqcI/YcgG family protein [Halomonas sabkhae]